MNEKHVKNLCAAALASVLAVSSAVGLSACGKDGGKTVWEKSGYTPEELSGKTVNLARELAADERRSTGKADDFTDTNLGFATELFKRAFEGENTLVSPLSMSIALSMTANGAREKTLLQMETVLGAPMSALNGGLSAYARFLESLSGDKLTLSVADSIWVKDDFAPCIKEGFLQTNKDFYDAEIFSSPFDQNTLGDINRWTKNKTEGMIENLLDQIPDSAFMYLVNALYFAGEWEEKYAATKVYDGFFRNADDTSSLVKLMSSTEKEYLSDENTQGFVKPYRGGKIAFAAFLPSENVSIEEYAASMSASKWKNLFENAKKDKSVNAVLPAFSYDFFVEAKELLQAMGMEDAFNEKTADFRDLSENAASGPYISRILQKTRIEVSEMGAKAAAATAGEMADKAVPEAYYVTLNRPFLYAIVDTENEYPLFLGAVTDLSE